MKRANYLLAILFFLPAISFGQAIHADFDSLYQDCRRRVLFSCNDSLVNNKVFTTARIEKDEAFFKKIQQAFGSGPSYSQVKKQFSRMKFTTLFDAQVVDDYKICRIIFYTNYTNGEIYFAYRNDSLHYRGCLIKTTYRQFCAQNSDHEMTGQIDFPFFRKHVLPFFSSYKIKEACSAFVVADGRELSWADMYGSTKYLQQIQ